MREMECPECGGLLRLAKEWMKSKYPNRRYCWRCGWEDKTEEDE